MGDLPLKNYSHDKPINQGHASPCPGEYPAQGRNFDLFAVMLFQLQPADLARKPDRGAPSSAGDPAEAEISSQSQARLRFCLKKKRLGS